ncbi:predicted protein [Plenodomus lingam JN3]|uniref:Predicted protein n=1 Tax=Leptosphaeria maculans (strain JN3 / isolate v23.1.3 / race Av1-4-5-6-7-8) TaxID=985895 RepID=E5R4Q9_LEPMJ|nr:predicted protein [Plenodomus lingam JN3]CBX92182.1 predicted protein [Plenodomus lingam JN3]
MRLVLPLFPPSPLPSILLPPAPDERCKKGQSQAALSAKGMVSSQSMWHTPAVLSVAGRRETMAVFLRIAVQAVQIIGRSDIYTCRHVPMRASALRSTTSTGPIQQHKVQDATGSREAPHLAEGPESGQQQPKKAQRARAPRRGGQMRDGMDALGSVESAIRSQAGVGQRGQGSQGNPGGEPRDALPSGFRGISWHWQP